MRELTDRMGRSKARAFLRGSARRVGGVTAGLVASVGLLGVAGAPAAQADTVTAWQNQATGLCLSNYPTMGDRLNSYICDYSNSQMWNVHWWNDGTFELKHVGSGRCLDDSAAYGLRVFPCNASKYQSWIPHRWNDGTVQLRNQATNWCLDHNYHDYTRMHPCNDTQYQSWRGQY